MSKAIGYIRVSTTRQAEQGQSLESQEAKVIGWAKANNLELLHIYKDEGKSGRKYGNRPKAQAAIAKTCETKGTLIVYSLSRLGRSLSDIIKIVEQLSKAGGDIVSLTEPINTTGAMGKAFLQICGVFAELESNLISERVKTINDFKRLNGEKLGGKVAYGYTWKLNKEGTKILVELPEEQAILEQIKEWWLQGYRSHIIMQRLNKMNVKAKNGGKWYRAAIDNIGRRLNKTLQS